MLSPHIVSINLSLKMIVNCWFCMFMHVWDFLSFGFYSFSFLFYKMNAVLKSLKISPKRGTVFSWKMPLLHLSEISCLQSGLNVLY